MQCVHVDTSMRRHGDTDDPRLSHPVGRRDPHVDRRRENRLEGVNSLPTAISFHFRAFRPSFQLHDPALDRPHLQMPSTSAASTVWMSVLRNRGMFSPWPAPRREPSRPRAAGCLPGCGTGFRRTTRLSPRLRGQSAGYRARLHRIPLPLIFEDELPPSTGRLPTSTTRLPRRAALMAA